MGVNSVDAYSFKKKKKNEICIKKGYFSQSVWKEVIKDLKSLICSEASNRGPPPDHTLHPSILIPVICET